MGFSGLKTLGHGMMHVVVSVVVPVLDFKMDLVLCDLVLLGCDTGDIGSHLALSDSIR